MIGLVIVSHGRLAEALIATASEIVGPFENCEILAVSRQDALDEVERAMEEAIQRVDRGRGVLVLADMFGGTAANVALRLVGKHDLEVVTGCNLPMLLKLSSALASGSDVKTLAQLIKFYGQRNVLVASELLKERENDG